MADKIKTSSKLIVDGEATQNNIIDLYGPDFKSCSYYDVGDRLLGLSMRDKSLLVLPLNKNDIEVICGESSHVYSREELSEFLQVACVLLDDENRWLPNFDLVALNYNGLNTIPEE